MALPLFGTGMKTDLFQSCGHCWVFQICWHIECSTLTASSFSIWSSSAEIPSLFSRDVCAKDKSEMFRDTFHGQQLSFLYAFSHFTIIDLQRVSFCALATASTLSSPSLLWFFHFCLLYFLSISQKHMFPKLWPCYLKKLRYSICP